MPSVSYVSRDSRGRGRYRHNLGTIEVDIDPESGGRKIEIGWSDVSGYLDLIRSPDPVRHLSINEVMERIICAELGCPKIWIKFTDLGLSWMTMTKKTTSGSEMLTDIASGDRIRSGASKIRYQDLRYSENNLRAR
jgi:hypothetical protein